MTDVNTRNANIHFNGFANRTLFREIMDSPLFVSLLLSVPIKTCPKINGRARIYISLRALDTEFHEFNLT